MNPQFEPEPEPILSPRRTPLPPVDFLAGKATEMCDRFALSEQGALYLTPRQSPYEFLEFLTAKRLYPDAARLLANELPKRDAARWAGTTYVLGTWNFT